MFSDFQNMFDKIKTGVNNVKNQVHTKQEDYANTPQKYNINGKQIQQIKLLSQGAFGFIWLAEDVQTKEQFALKRVICMTEDRLKQSRLEKQVMSIFPKSQFIVRYHGGDIVSRNAQKVVITLMELCDGGTLFDMLEKRQNKGFTEDQLVKIVLSVASGLQTIHQTGYYHRDVKIQNVLLGKDKKFKLCDFGSCTKQVFNFSEIHKRQYDLIKQKIQSITTPMYRPPEIVDPYLQFTVNSKVDIWMLGCVLYTLCYFTHPFIDSNAIGISSGTYRFPKYPDETPYKVSEKIKDLIRNMLTPHPNFRPSSIQLINLLKIWNSLSEVPLNLQAVRRKKQENQKQRQLQKLHKKCVDFDGDIPIQKLIELQKRLKKTQIQDKPFQSFSKKTQGLKSQSVAHRSGVNIKNNLQTNPFGINHIRSNNHQNVNNNQISKPQQKNKINFDNLWGIGFTHNNLNKPSTTKIQQSSQPNSSFDFFNCLGSNNKLSQTQSKINKSNINFQQMFAQTQFSNISNDFKIFSVNKNNQNIKISGQNIDLIDL